MSNRDIDTHATRNRARKRAAKAAWWKAAGQLPAREHELFRAQEHAVQVAEQREHDRDRDQVALVELELHAVGGSALKLFTVNTSKFYSFCSRLARRSAACFRRCVLTAGQRPPKCDHVGYFQK